MAKYKFIVTIPNCSYGTKGELIELDSKDLTERQKVMLAPYEAPKVKKMTTAKAPATTPAATE